MPNERKIEPTSAARASTQPTQGQVAAPPAIPPSSRWDTATKRSVIMLLLALTVFIFWLARGVLPWLIVAGILSYLLNPVVDLLTRIRVPRTLATLLVFALVLILMILLPVFIVPVLVQQAGQLAAFDVTKAATGMLNWLLRTINELPDQVVILGITVPTGNVVNQLETGFQQITFVPTLAEMLGYLQQAITTATGIVSSTAALSVTVVARIFSGVITAIVIFFFSLYLTKDFPAIRAYIEGLFPSSYQPELRELFRRIGYTWSSFFRGQIILSVVMGTLTWFTMTLVGMPGALILGILAGMLEVVPNLGPIIATIPAVVIALIQGSTVLAPYGVGNVGFALIVIAIYFVMQQVEGNVLVPRIIGDSVNLHPVVVIAGVAIGFNAFGVLGAFLAAPTLATGRAVGGYVHAKLLDYPPFLDSKSLPKRGPNAYRFRATGEQLAAEAEKPVPPIAASTPSAAAEGAPAPEAPERTERTADSAPLRAV